MTEKDFIWRDNYHRPGDNEEDKMERFENTEYQAAIEALQKKHSRLVKITAAMASIIVILMAVLIFRGRNLADKNQVAAIEDNFDRLEGEFTSLKVYIASKLDQAIKEMERDRRPPVTQDSTPAKTEPTVEKDQKKASPKVHKVLPGESLARIGRYYGLTVSQLRLYNDLDTDSIIHPGQELRLTP
jgi:LysM repeat protein